MALRGFLGAMLLPCLCLIVITARCSLAQEKSLPAGEGSAETVEIDIGASRDGSRTDAEVVSREEEAIKLDGLNVAQMREIREKSEKFAFQAEVNRMMKLIINSLYRNKEIFLRELISNASDALDKIRLLSLTMASVIDANPDMNIKIRADKDGKTLHIIDSGVGMTKQDLITNLGTIAKSGTADFLSKMQDSGDKSDMNDMIGQFGVGFYSAFLVADRVTVTTKHNDDVQYIWESDAGQFSIIEDPRGDTLKRGTQISLHLKDEALDFLEQDTLRNLIQKYSQFINFPIYLWASKTIQVEEPIEEEDEKPVTESEDEDADAQVEEDASEEKPKTKKIDKTVYDWEVINDSKPIWTRKPAEIEDDEYDSFYKSLTKDKDDPLCKVHFVAEGEVTFKSLLFVPKVQPSEGFNKYGTKTDHIKLYVRRVFITDEFNDMMPNYLAFIQGVVDSDDLPLNVSRETLQQHKLIKVIKKKLVRKALDMLKKISKDDYDKFWKEYSTNIKLGIMEDPSNRTRLAKLLQFYSSNGDGMTSLSDYVERMKPKQDKIFYIAGANKAEVQKSPFVERLLKAGYEVLYLVEAVDEYAISALPEFDGRKFQNVAKEGFTLAEILGEDQKEAIETFKKTYEPLLNWLGDNALKEHITKALVSERLSSSPCALVASMFGWTGNMERLAMSNAHQKTDDPQRSYYLNQKKTLEINPRHPLIKELLRRVNDNPEDPKAKEIALMMFKTATLRSGYMLLETADFAETVEMMMRQTLGIPLDEQPDEEDFLSSQEDDSSDKEQQHEDEIDAEDHDEL